MNSATLAKALGVSLDTLGLWVSQGMPRLTPGRGKQPSLFYSGDVIDWLRDRAKNKAAQSDGDVENFIKANVEGKVAASSSGRNGG